MPKSPLTALALGALKKWALVCLLCQLSLVAVASSKYDADHPSVSRLSGLLERIKDNTLSPELSTEDASELNLDLIYNGIHWESFFRLVFGREWLKLSDEQRTALGDEFRVLIAGVYANTIDEISAYEVEFLGAEESPRPHIVSVVKRVTPKDGSDSFILRTKMRLVDEVWLVFDFVGGGVSIASAFKSNYRPLLAKEGFDKLLDIVKNKIAERLEQKIDKNGALAKGDKSLAKDDKSLAKGDKSLTKGDNNGR